MFKRILAPHDGTEESLKACRMAASLASALGGRVTLVRVIDPDSLSEKEVPAEYAEETRAIPHPEETGTAGGPTTPTAYGGAPLTERMSEEPETVTVPESQMMEAARAQAIAELQKVREGSGLNKLFGEPLVVFGDPVEKLLQLVRGDRFDMAVVATHRSSRLERVFAGSVADEVARRATIPTVVLNPAESRDSSTWTDPPDTVIVPVTTDESSMRAVPAAEELARLLNAKIIFVHAQGMTSEMQSLAAQPDRGAAAEAQQIADEGFEETQEMLESLRSEARGRGLEADTVLQAGDPGQTVKSLADRTGRPIVVMWSKGTRGLERMLFGSMADALKRQSGLPVMVVPERVDLPSATNW